jgi:hypothetical protein
MKEENDVCIYACHDTERGFGIKLQCGWGWGVRGISASFSFYPSKLASTVRNRSKGLRNQLVA